MIVILGPEDIHTLRVKARIEARNEKAIILTSDHYPKQVTISSSVADGGGFALESSGFIPTSEIKAVYWYGYSGVCTGTSYPLPEAESAFGSFLRSLECRWVNPPESIEHHKYKFHQLKMLHEAGIRIPNTLMSNNPDDVLRFYEKHGGNVICKPLYQGLMLHKVTPDDLRPENLEVLRQSPTLFQEYIDGQDVRVHVVGDNVFPSAIISELFNYKTSFKAEPVDISPKIQTACLVAAKTLGLTLAGVDIRIDNNGNYVMFEVNPSPQYLTFENQLGKDGEYPITEALVDCLLSH